MSVTNLKQNLSESSSSMSKLVTLSSSTASSALLKYSLADFNKISFDGFNLTLAEETVNMISKLALEVGSPTYVKTPVFQKREIPVATKPSSSGPKKKHRNVALTDEEWTRQTKGPAFQVTKIEQKVGNDVHISNIRTFLNKITDKNYLEFRNKIVEVIDMLIAENINEEEFARVSVAIFDIATNIRYYSKIYADLYCDLIQKYEPMRVAFESSFSTFTELFNDISYVDPDVDYNKFCENNEANEKRKSLSTFFVNLMLNGMIDRNKIIHILHHLLSQIHVNMVHQSKRNEINEMAENIALLYNRELKCSPEFENWESTIGGMTIPEVMQKLATADIKVNPGLTSKVKFKFMDILGL